jgi:hypothetical protein
MEKITTGDDNTSAGYAALLWLDTGSRNTAVGSNSGYHITYGSSNVAIGYRAGHGIETGVGNIAVGVGTFEDGEQPSEIDVGNFNIAVGFDALYAGPSGSHNIGIGNAAGSQLRTGERNTLIGSSTGSQLNSGSGNVFIGYRVGSNAGSNASNLLYIDNSNTNSPLIYGSFSDGSEAVIINGTFTSTGDVTLGSGTSATGGSIIMNDNSTSDSFTATISLANLSASRAYTIPEVSADASFVMTEGAQTVNGAKTFGSAAVFNTSAKLKSNNGSGGVILQAGAMSNTDVTYTLPLSDGSSGQVLSTAGNGTLSWTTATSVAAINDLTDAVKNIANFSNSMVLGTEVSTMTGASNNTAVGMAAMDAITSGDDNTVLGYNAATVLSDGSQNVVVGSGAGALLASGSGNVMIGYQAGANETGSNKLYIDNSSSATPLVQGDFNANTLTFNGSTTTTGNVTISGTTTYTAPGTAKAVTANTTAGAGAQAIASFTNTYERVDVTATTATGYVKLPAGATDGQIVYLHMIFTANGSNTVTIVNSDNSNTTMDYDGTGADHIIAHMMYTTAKGWVIFYALEYN